MCRLFSGTAPSPAPELCPTLLWAPGLGSWGAWPAPQQMGLPSSFPATTQPPSPVLVARERAKQSQGSPKARHPTFSTVGVHGGRTGNVLHTPHTVPSQTHTIVLPALQDGWDMDTGAPLTFWGIARLGRVLMGLGQLAVQMPVLTILSPCQSGSATLQLCSLQDPAVWSQARAVSPPSQPCTSSGLNPMRKADKQLRIPLGSLLHG